MVEVLGYYNPPSSTTNTAVSNNPADAGGGLFYWDASSTDANDDGVIIIPDSSPAAGRWYRVFDGPVSIAWFGAVGDYIEWQQGNGNTYADGQAWRSGDAGSTWSAEGDDFAFRVWSYEAQVAGRLYQSEKDQPFRGGVDGFVTSDTSEGASIIKSRLSPVLGKAITSRIFGSLNKIAKNLSNPGAIPP